MRYNERGLKTVHQPAIYNSSPGHATTSRTSLLISPVYVHIKPTSLVPRKSSVPFEHVDSPKPVRFHTFHSTPRPTQVALDFQNGLLELAFVPRFQKAHLFPPVMTLTIDAEPLQLLFCSNFELLF
jgi:hypothetical protein